jgi:hypothetical protein
MAVYKVIQDVEAEDKLLGPLTLKGFIYAGVAGLCGFIEFRLLLIASPIKWPFILIFALPMFLFGVLASPLGREQPTEVWLLSRIRFFLKPRQRIWDQSGLQELVTITAPKKVERQLTKNLDQTEVQSRLKTLALTLDTRGWAVKNVDVNLGSEDKREVIDQDSDRLIGSADLPQPTETTDVHAADDILDEKNNPTAKKFEAMMQKAEVNRKHGVLSAIKDLVDKDQPAGPIESTKDLPSTKAALKAMTKTAVDKKVQQQAETEIDLQARLAKARVSFGAEFSIGHKKSDPRHRLAGSRTPLPAKIDKSTPVTAARQAVNMELAQSGSAFSVATLSQLANRPGRIGPNEVVIPLH